MLRLLHNIRKQLLNEGKTSKYFRYAIGEILLVMIGILLALQVNNWNESRKQNLIEIKIVKQLLEDAKADAVFFQSRIMHQHIRDTLYNYLIMASEQKANDSILNLEVKADPFFHRLAYQSNLINNNPEAYDLISDDSLKTKLRAYKAKYDYVVHSIELSNRVGEQYGMPLQVKYYADIKELPERSTYSDFSFAYNDVETVATFAMRKNYGFNYNIQVNNFLKTNEELIALLKHYLNTNN